MVSKFERLSTKKQLNDEAAIRLRDEIVRLYLRYADNANNWDLVDLSAPKIIGRWLMIPSMLGDKQIHIHQGANLRRAIPCGDIQQKPI